MITYEECGVSTTKNDRLVEKLKSIIGIDTGFADVKPIPGSDQFIAQCMDGVCTKIRLASEYPSIYNSIGQDLVAMCVNDLICIGALPAYFQDYIGMNSLDEEMIPKIIKSINDACVIGGVKLTGGEMAEMPGNYKHDYPELVGCATGFCSSDHLINKNNVVRGDILVALESNGPHSNGYSLIRNIHTAYKDKFPPSVLKAILEPTVLYYGVSDYYHYEPDHIHAMAHITGGGLENNLARSIPVGLKAKIDYERWSVPEVFVALQQLGDVDPDSMWDTFNMGIGMVLICSLNTFESVIDGLSEYNAFAIGEIVTD